MGEKRQTLSAGRDTDAPSGQVETPISARPHVFEVLEETGAPGGDTLASHRRSSAGRRDSSYRCLMFFLNWNIVLRLLLSPSSRHTPLSAATSNLSRLHSAFHATVILKAGGSEDFLMWYFSTMWFFSLFLWVAALYSPPCWHLIVIKSRLQRCFFCFLPRRCDSFELSVVFPAPCFGRKCGNCVILLQVRVLFSCTFVFYGNSFNLSQKISLSFLGLICILKKYSQIVRSQIVECEISISFTL